MQMEFDVNEVKKVISEQNLQKPLPLLEDTIIENTPIPSKIEYWGWSGRKGRSTRSSARTPAEVTVGVAKIEEKTPAYIYRKIMTPYTSVDFDKTSRPEFIQKSGMDYLSNILDEEDECSLITAVNAAADASEITKDTLLQDHNFAYGWTDQEVVNYLDSILSSLDEYNPDIDRLAVSAISGNADRLRRILYAWTIGQSGGTLQITADKISPRVQKLLTTGIRVIRSEVYTGNYGDNRVLATPPYTLGYSAFLYSSKSSATPTLRAHRWDEVIDVQQVPRSPESEKDLIEARHFGCYVGNRKSCILIKDAFKPKSA